MDYAPGFWFLSFLTVIYLNYPHVCAAKNETKERLPPGAMAEKMCKKYAEAVHYTISSPTLVDTTSTVTEKVNHCGISSSTLIIGGEAARPKEFPHMVLVGHRDYPIIWSCGGSLISDKWVLSAAHCTATPTANGTLAKWILLGDLKVNSDDDQENSSPTTIKIRKRINHPDYKGRTAYNDLALYMLDRPVQFNAFIRPMCLQSKFEVVPDSAIATGWGKTIANEENSVSQILRKVKLDLLKNPNVCKKKYERASPNLLARIPDGIDDQRMLCAWTENKDTCQGDSGGPLQIQLDDPFCMYSIIGITSFGEDCAKSKPGVYTRVSHYIEWIENIVWPS